MRVKRKLKRRNIGTGGNSLRSISIKGELSTWDRGKRCIGPFFDFFTF
jgi:hypothetical protein